MSHRSIGFGSHQIRRHDELPEFAEIADISHQILALVMHSSEILRFFGQMCRRVFRVKSNVCAAALVLDFMVFSTFDTSNI